MNIGIIFAGGVGSRMNTREKPKQFLNLYNKPIIIYTLEHFENNPDIDAVVVQCVSDWMSYLAELLEHFQIHKVKKIVPGGMTGQESIYHGLLAAREISEEKNPVVLIHDGVRPLINSQLLTECIDSVKRYGNAIVSGKVTETITVIDESGGVDIVVPRDQSRVAKAPQCFRLLDIIAAHERARNDRKKDFIDSCTMMTHYGYKMHLIDGPDENIKITTPSDYYSVRAILDAKENAQIYGAW